jgi:hypothetical protein
MEIRKQIARVDVELEVLDTEINRQRRYCMDNIVPRLKSVGDEWLNKIKCNKTFVYSGVKVIIENFIKFSKTGNKFPYRTIRVKHRNKTVFIIQYAKNSFSWDCLKVYHKGDWIEHISPLMVLIRDEIRKEEDKKELSLKLTKLEELKKRRKNFVSYCD